MIEQDTIRLLRECDAGVKMGISSTEEALKYVQNEELKQYLEACIHDNQVIERQIQEQLEEYHDDGKEPNPMAKGMSWIKTNVKLTVNESDNAIAELIIDGCNMGVKSLSGFLNEYETADDKSKKLAKKLINIEERFAADIRKFL